MTRRDEQTLRCGRLARELPNRIALVAGGLGDPGEAEQICRELHELLEEDYCLTFKPWACGAKPGSSEAPVTAQQPAPAGTAFVGRVIATKFATVCKVCRAPLPAGAEVIWQQGVGCACVTCGEIAA